MATKTSQFIIDVETRRAVARTAALEKQFKQLGGAARLAQLKGIAKLERGINQLATSGKKGNIATSRFTQGIALGNIAANAATAAIRGLSAGFKAFIIDGTKLAARIEVLNHVVEFTGKNAGFTAGQIHKNTNAIKALGITTKESLEIQQRFIQAELDIADATKVARLAQDAAVIAGTNSSEAALQITDAINKGRPVLLKQFGIMVDLNTAYRDFAEANDKAASSLTAAEKKQALMNAVLEQGKTISGAYITAMRDVGKRMTSLPRHFDEATAAIGRHFIPALGNAVDDTKDFLEAIEAAFQSTAEATSEFFASQKAFEDDAATTLEMAARYDELLGQQEKQLKLTAEEQLELNKLIEQLSTIFPVAITEWNSYGKAVGISTDKIKDYLKVRREVFQFEEADLVAGAADEYENLQNKLRLAGRALVKFTGSMSASRQTANDVAIAEQKVRGEITKFVMAFNQGFNAVTNYVEAVQSLGFPLANALRRFQQNDEALKGYNKTVTEAEKKAQKLAAAHQKVVDSLPEASLEEEEEAPKKFTKQLREQETFAKLRRQITLESSNQLTRDLLQIEFDRHDAVKQLRDLAILDEEFRNQMIAQVDAQAAVAREQAHLDSNERLREQWLENHRIIGDAVNSFFSGLASSIQNNGKVWKDAIKAMGASVVSGIGQIATKAFMKFLASIFMTTSALAAETVQVNVLTASYLALAAAKAAAGAGGGPVGVLASVFSLFDDPVNDTRLRRESRTATQDVAKERRRMGSFIADGIGQGLRLNSLPAGPEVGTQTDAAPRNVYINIDAAGVSAEDIARQIEQVVYDDLSIIETSEERVRR